MTDTYIGYSILKINNRFLISSQLSTKFKLFKNINFYKYLFEYLVVRESKWNGDIIKRINDAINIIYI